MEPSSFDFLKRSPPKAVSDGSFPSRKAEGINGRHGKTVFSSRAGGEEKRREIAAEQGRKPEKGGREISITRHLRNPGEQNSTNHGREGASLSFIIGNNIFQRRGAAGSDLRHVVHDIVILFESLVVAVGESGEVQAVGNGGVGLGHEAVRVDGGGEGDLYPQADEALGELERWVDVALRREGHQKNMRLHHCHANQERTRWRKIYVPQGN
nr:hypothetical protein Iba_chr14dCG14320 [Ipomoea batatas]